MGALVLTLRLDMIRGLYALLTKNSRATTHKDINNRWFGLGLKATALSYIPFFGYIYIYPGTYLDKDSLGGAENGNHNAMIGMRCACMRNH